MKFSICFLAAVTMFASTADAMKVLKGYKYPNSDCTGERELIEYGYKIVGLCSPYLREGQSFTAIRYAEDGTASYYSDLGCHKQVEFTAEPNPFRCIKYELSDKEYEPSDFTSWQLVEHKEGVEPLCKVSSPESYKFINTVFFLKDTCFEIDGAWINWDSAENVLEVYPEKEAGKNCKGDPRTYIKDGDCKYGPDLDLAEEGETLLFSSVGNACTNSGAQSLQLTASFALFALAVVIQA